MIPTNVDCIILGTGLTNSILAAAFSRIGKSVLHLDENNYYGDQWASFTFQQLIDWIKLNNHPSSCLDSIPEELLNKSRMFCIDLCPRLLYSNGAMVDLLVKSNVSRYHEFKNNIRILSMVQDEIHVMPCRRADVFTSPLLSDLIDKRKLMKFIEICIKYESDSENNEISSNADKPIGEFLDERGLKPNLKDYIINSIAMVKPTDPTREACEKIKNFMIATERFGRSPFIFPLYGCGEFPQSFCRLSAVFGGVYCLNTQVKNVKMEGIQENFAVEFSTNEVKTDLLLLDNKRAISLGLTKTSQSKKCLARAILFLNESIIPNSENLISFLRIPPSEKNANTVYCLEFNSSVMVCPPEIHLVYLWTKSTSLHNAEDELRPTVERIIKESSIVWKFYYLQTSGDDRSQNYEEPGGTESRGLYITNSTFDDLDYGDSIKEAEKIFKNIYPDQDFLPRAPDPDEIVT